MIMSYGVRNRGRNRREKERGRIRSGGIKASRYNARKQSLVERRTIGVWKGVGVQ